MPSTQNDELYEAPKFSKYVSKIFSNDYHLNSILKRRLLITLGYLICTFDIKQTI